MAMNEVKAALTQMHRAYAGYYKSLGQQPTTEYVEEWDAPCYVGEPSEGFIAWQAVEQEPAVDFANVEQALKMPLHESVKAFFSVYWAGDVDVLFQGHPITLLQVQLPEDADRLQQNLIGHVMMKQRLKQPVTLFIGVAAEDDLILTVNNETGTVGFEYVGKEQHE